MGGGLTMSALLALCWEAIDKQRASLSLLPFEIVRLFTLLFHEGYHQAIAFITRIPMAPYPKRIHDLQ